jgi:hypothetical protein
MITSQEREHTETVGLNVHKPLQGVKTRAGGSSPGKSNGSQVKAITAGRKWKVKACWRAMRNEDANSCEWLIEFSQDERGGVARDPRAED